MKSRRTYAGACSLLSRRAGSVLVMLIGTHKHYSYLPCTVLLPHTYTAAQDKPGPRQSPLRNLGKCIKTNIRCWKVWSSSDTQLD